MNLKKLYFIWTQEQHHNVKTTKCTNLINYKLNIILSNKIMLTKQNFYF